MATDLQIQFLFECHEHFTRLHLQATRQADDREQGRLVLARLQVSNIRTAQTALKGKGFLGKALLYSKAAKHFSKDLLNFPFHCSWVDRLDKVGRDRGTLRKAYFTSNVCFTIRERTTARDKVLTMEKKPIYKQRWLGVIVAVLALGLLILIADYSTPFKEAASSLEAEPSDKPDLEVFDVNLRISRTGARYITGKVRNNRSRAYSAVQVHFDLLDDNGYKVGTAWDLISSGLESGEVWSFEAGVFDRRARRYRFDTVLGYEP